jgi:hypothetical protein
LCRSSVVKNGIRFLEDEDLLVAVLGSVPLFTVMHVGRNIVIVVVFSIRWWQLALSLLDLLLDSCCPLS